MSAIAQAVDPFLVKAEGRTGTDQFRHLRPALRGTYQHFNIRKRQERGIEVRWVHHPQNLDEWKPLIGRGHPLPLHGGAEQSPAVVRRPQGPGRPGPFLGDPVHHRRHVREARPEPGRSPGARTSSSHSLTKSITAGGLAIGGALISRKPIVTKMKNDHPLFKESFAEYVKLLPYRDNGPAASPINAMFALTTSGRSGRAWISSAGIA